MINVGDLTLPVNLGLSGIVTIFIIAIWAGRLVPKGQVQQLLDLKDEIIKNKEETVQLQKTQLAESVEITRTLKKVLLSLPQAKDDDLESV